MQTTMGPSNYTVLFYQSRDMHEYCQDGMTYMQSHGKPDVFMTMTCNPKWPEIQTELLEGQTPQDRHDLLARVFHLKLRKLIYVITKGNIFGEINCWMYTIEWQKQGLPHAHILIWFKNKLTPNRIDSVISAEIPDPAVDPELFDM